MMNVAQRQILDHLANVRIMTYQNCARDRKKLSTIEWQSPEDSPSILGEMEIKSDNIAGIVLGCVMRSPEDVSGTIEILENNAIFQYDVLANWAASHAENFEDFFYYMIAVETMRTCAIAFLTERRS